ncbi:MAG: porin OmpL1 [Spirochaetota bacterium]
MKKFLVVMLAMAVALSFGSMAMAKDGLSVDLGFAWNFNGADMTKTIVKDGEAGAGNTLLTGDAIMAENVMLSLEKVSDLSNGLPGAQTVKADTNGGMQGLSTALRARYDFMNAFFVRLGVAYDMKVLGGDSTLTLNNFDAAGIPTGSKVTQKWDYSALYIPLTIGINVPVSEKFNIYAGLGLTYYTGGWSIEVKAPAVYTGVAAAGDEDVEFKASGIGFNWTVGASTLVYENLSVFIELDAQVAGGMSDVQTLDSAGGINAFGSNKVAYPVNLSQQLVRFGVSYYIMAL